MTTPVLLFAKPQELKTLRMVLTPATYPAKMDNSGRMKTTNVRTNAMLLGNKSLKTVFFTAKSLANKDNGGTMKPKLANLNVMPHGYKDQPTMSQLALSHAQLVSIGDLMTRLVLPFAKTQEFKMLTT